MNQTAPFLVTACFAVMLAACDRVPPPSTAQETSTVNALTSTLKTRCVGRYLVDMPADAAMFGSLEVQGVSIEATPMPLNDYHRAMQARSEELAGTKSFFGYRFLYADTVVEGIPESRFFVSLGDRYANSDTDRLIEGYRWSRGHEIKMQIMASDARNSVAFKDDPSVRNDPAMSNAQAKSWLVAALLNHVRGRDDDEIPTEPGVCFQGGFLAGKQHGSEKATADFILPSHPDVRFVLETNTEVHDATTLLQRSADVNAAIAADKNGKSLRKGHVELQGMKAEEWLFSATTNRKIPGFLFSLEANSLPSEDHKPVVTLDLRIGGSTALNRNMPPAEKTSLTENESLALWDKVSRTLRPRPNAF